MLIQHLYYPFTSESTRTIAGYKINLYDIHSCILYPRVELPSLLHIKTIHTEEVSLTDNGVVKNTICRVLDIANDNDDIVCGVALMNVHDTEIYHGIAFDRFGYCGEMELSKEAYRAITALPDGILADSNSFVFDPDCVYFNPMSNAADLTVDDVAISSIALENQESDNVVLSTIDNHISVTTKDTSIPDRMPVKTINNTRATHICLVNTPESTVRVTTDGNVITIGRGCDL